jgi:lipopolysaccharide export LptBFGC system permease protein LptF
MFLHNLSKTNELLIILASGVHLWRVFSIMMMFTFCLGLFFVGIVNPLASFALQKYDKLSAKLSNRYSATMFVTKSKIFFREYTEQENYFIAASSVDIGRNKIYNVSLIVTNAQYKFLYRAEAQEASINNNNLILHNPVISSTDKIQTLPELSFPTKISLYQLTLSLKSPEKISIWQLPNMIDYSSQSGLPVTKYQLHYYKELAKPFAMVAMSQIPYLFLNLSTRRNKTSHIMHAVVLNIITYGVLEFVFRVLAYNGLSPAWSVMLPLAFIILIINFAILHLQEA